MSPWCSDRNAEKTKVSGLSFWLKLGFFSAAVSGPRVSPSAEPLPEPPPVAAEVSSSYLAQPQLLFRHVVLFPLVLTPSFLPSHPCLYFISQSLGFPLCLPFGFSYFSGWMLQLGRTQPWEDPVSSSCLGLQLHARLCLKNADFP